MYDWIIANKELCKVFYLLTVAVICTIIVLKADRLFRISLHPGIRYFRNAFFFYGIAFITRYFLGANFLSAYVNFNPYLINSLFEFFLIMAGFSLFYSLLWKKFESSKMAFSSLFNFKIIIFYFMAFMIVILDNLWGTYAFMFFSQIILFSCASVISYINYKKNGAQHKFLGFYFIAMLLNLFAWSLNALVALYFNWNKIMLMNVYVLNIIIFLLFLVGVIKVTKVK
ncbi:hypothetical protein KAR52_01170 [Candidatus Pacearchaeota archaeon]|nr:hypothetical protein [Candidatus Pacearchaeota archaeon]